MANKRKSESRINKIAQDGKWRDVQITNLKQTEKEYWESEPATRCFCVRVPKKGEGKKQYIYRYNRFGGRTTIPLGKCGATDLKDAREEAEKYNHMRRKGTDPRQEIDRIKAGVEAEEKRLEQEKRETELAVSVNAVFDHYLGSVSSSTARDAENIFTNQFCNIRREIGEQKIREITADQLKMLVNTHKERGKMRTAGKAYAYMKAAFNRAEDDEDDRFLLEGWNNPFVRYKKPKGTDSKAVERNLSIEEIRVLWRMLDDETMGLVVSKILRLILLTGQRVEQVSRMQWEHISRSEGAWSLPPGETKIGKRSGRAHVVPLCPMALEVIDSVRVIADERFLFQGRGSGAVNDDGVQESKPIYLGSISAKVRKVLAATNTLDHFTPRDLRRTATTQMSRIGIDSETRNRVQDHAISGVEERHYNRYSHFQEKRAALMRWEAELMRIINREDESVVVQLHG